LRDQQVPGELIAGNFPRGSLAVHRIHMSAAPEHQMAEFMREGKSLPVGDVVAVDEHDRRLPLRVSRADPRDPLRKRGSPDINANQSLDNLG
jgi:hypothetical protein